MYSTAEWLVHNKAVYWIRTCIQACSVSCPSVRTHSNHPATEPRTQICFQPGESFTHTCEVDQTPVCRFACRKLPFSVMFSPKKLVNRALNEQPKANSSLFSCQSHTFSNPQFICWIADCDKSACWHQTRTPSWMGNQTCFLDIWWTVEATVVCRCALQGLWRKNVFFSFKCFSPLGKGLALCQTLSQSDR